MPEVVDEHFVEHVRRLTPGSTETGIDPDLLLTLFDAQVQSRHLDFAARRLQAQGEGFYTIGSAGHEANAAVGLLTRVEDPALLHYRSGGFYAARAARHAGEQPGTATDPLFSVTFHDSRGYALGGLTSRPDGVSFAALERRGLRLVLDPVLFTRGTYGVTAAIYANRILRSHDVRPRVLSFMTDGPSVATRGDFVLPHRWEVVGKGVAQP